MLEKDNMMKLKLHKLMKVGLYLFLRNTTTRTVSVLFVAMTNILMILLVKIHIQIIVQLPTLLLAQSHIKPA